jgi:predicted MFS family arabinose efflux permease
LKQISDPIKEPDGMDTLVLGRASGYGVRHQGYRALRNRNFRLYLFGLVISQIGTYMQLVTEGWLVYRLTNSAFALGLVGFVSMLPLAPLTLIAGALADRFPRRTLLTITQIGQVFPPLILAGLTFSNHVQVWQIVILDLAMGAFSAIDQPTRQALVADITPREDLDSAIALSATGYSAARVVGPAIAGLLVAVVGESVCFALNGLSFVAVIVALTAMRIPPQKIILSTNSIATDVMNSGRYLWREPVILASIGIIVIINLFLVPYQTLLPVFARDLLGVGALGLGLLAAAAGLGAILGSLGAVQVPRGTRRGRLILGLGVGASLGTLIFAFSPAFLFSSLMLLLLSCAIIAIKVLAISSVQGRVQDNLRGRVMAVVVLFDAGIPRLGGLGVGFLATSWGAPIALGLSALSGLACIVGLGVFIPKFRDMS